MGNELAKMSPKGQLVVPQEIREEGNFCTGDRFVPFPVKGGVFFKKVKIPDVKVEFKKLFKEIEKRFEKNKITTKDVDEAVKWARK